MHVGKAGCADLAQRALQIMSAYVRLYVIGTQQASNDVSLGNIPGPIGYLQNGALLYA
jgi:hypothetical protein